MGKIYDQINPQLQEWIAQQQLFFVATAPLDANGLVNCSPKGLDTFRVIDANTVAYLDLTGSGVETIAHLKENQRITIMFCALNGAPKILRLYGKGRVLEHKDAEFADYARLFPAYLSTRAVILIDVERIADSCGYGVPNYEFLGHRDTLVKWGEKKGEEGIKNYQQEKNLKSLDGLDGLGA
jgi:predicted pyridoxine 5'-phosphate oxidase superfamily flavin-nucleotide-binding protein